MIRRTRVAESVPLLDPSTSTLWGLSEQLPVVEVVRFVRNSLGRSGALRWMDTQRADRSYAPCTSRAAIGWVTRRHRLGTDGGFG
jgi:hypothetical protein